MKRFLFAALIAAGLVLILRPTPSILEARTPPSGAGLIITKNCDTPVINGATVNCTGIIKNRDSRVGGSVSDLLVQNTDPSGSTSALTCTSVFTGMATDTLARNGSAGDTCTVAFTETAWTCNNPTAFRDRLFGSGTDDLDGLDALGEAFFTVDIIPCTPTITPTSTLTPTPGGSTSTPTPTPVLPDMIPFAFPGWSAPVVVTNIFGGITNTSPFLTTDTLYFNWGMENQGPGTMPGSCLNTIYLDGAPLTSWSFPASPSGTTGQITEVSLGTLAAGTHTLALIVNDNFAFPEVTRANNTYTNTFIVAAPTPTFTRTPSTSPTFTPTSTGTITATFTRSNTPTNTPRVPRTVPFRPTNTPTSSPTPPPTSTGTITATRTATVTPTVTPTAGPVCSGIVSVSVTGPSTSARFVTNTYTATASGGTPPYRYSWSCDFNLLAPVFLPGQRTVRCLFPSARPYIVEALVKDAATHRGYCGMTVSAGP